MGSVSIKQTAFFVAMLVVFNSIQTSFARIGEKEYFVPDEPASPADPGQFGECKC
jgi:hypothetical protein